MSGDFGGYFTFWESAQRFPARNAVQVLKLPHSEHETAATLLFQLASALTPAASPGPCGTPAGAGAARRTIPAG